jgi:hypothetical protein
VLLVSGLTGCVSLLYTTTGQAGGTAFLAVMAFAATRYVLADILHFAGLCLLFM